MPLDRLQGWLERLYDVNVSHRAEHTSFRRTARCRRALVTECGLGDTPEALLVHESIDGLEMSLYLGASVMERLRRRDPLVALDTENFLDLLLAIEGVSHFVSLAWHALSDRPVSQLALELQAEVDKFVVAHTLITDQHGSGAARPLHCWLFSRTTVRPGLCHLSRQRYLLADRLAAGCCRILLRRASRGPWPPRTELRRFFRLSPSEKVRHAAIAL